MIANDQENDGMQRWAHAPVVTKDARTVIRFHPRTEFICSIISVSILVLVATGPAFLLSIGRAQVEQWLGLLGGLMTPLILTVLSKFRSWSLLLAILLVFLVIAPMLTYAYFLVTNQPFTLFEPGPAGAILYGVCCAMMILPICRWGLPFGHYKSRH